MVDRQTGRSLDEIQIGHRLRYEWAARRLNDLGVSGTILDAACGTGYGAGIIATSNRRVVGVDISRQAVEQAKDLWPGDFIKWDIENPLFAGNVFAGVVSFETLEHLPNPERALNNFRQSSRLLFASVPNEDVEPFHKDKFKGNRYPHLRHYTPEQFHGLLDSTGWQVKETLFQQNKVSPPEKVETGRFIIVEAHAR